MSGFLLAEDEALRNLLVGMTVSDKSNATRPVGVWFGQPDPEIRAQSFPFVTIDLVDISEATERVMNARVDPWYAYTSEDAETLGWDIWYPTPLNLDYQISVFSRQPRHDRQIMQQLMTTRLPLRFGSINVIHRYDEEEIDGETELVGQATARRLDVLDIVKRDITEAGKRMFMNAISVRISSEVVTMQSLATYYKVLEIRLKTTNYHPSLGLPRSVFDEVESVIVPPPGTP